MTIADRVQVPLPKELSVSSTHFTHTHISISHGDCFMLHLPDHICPLSDICFILGCIFPSRVARIEFIHSKEQDIRKLRGKYSPKLKTITYNLNLIIRRLNLHVDRQFIELQLKLEPILHDGHCAEPKRCVLISDIIVWMVSKAGIEVVHAQDCWRFKGVLLWAVLHSVSSRFLQEEQDLQLV